MLTINKGIEVKTKWSELTYTDLQELLAIPQDTPLLNYHTKLLQIVTGKDEDWVNQVVPYTIEKLIPHLEFLFAMPKLNKSVKLQDKTIDLNNIKPEFKTYGAKMLYNRNLTDYNDGKISFEAFCSMGAKIYLHSELSDRFDEKGIDAVDLSGLIPVEVMLINDFFLKGLVGS